MSSFGRAKATSYGSQTLLDPAARLRDMDAEGLDVQVIFSTVFPVAAYGGRGVSGGADAELEHLDGQRLSPAPERLKWAAMMPLQNRRRR